MLKQLRNDDLFKASIDKVDEQKRKEIASIVEDFVGAFADAIDDIITQVKEDPGLAQHLNEALAHEPNKDEDGR